MLSFLYLSVHIYNVGIMYHRWRRGPFSRRPVPAPINWCSLRFTQHIGRLAQSHNIIGYYAHMEYNRRLRWKIHIYFQNKHSCRMYVNRVWPRREFDDNKWYKFLVRIRVDLRWGLYYLCLPVANFRVESVFSNLIVTNRGLTRRTHDRERIFRYNGDWKISHKKKIKT